METTTPAADTTNESLAQLKTLEETLTKDDLDQPVQKTVDDMKEVEEEEEEETPEPEMEKPTVQPPSWPQPSSDEINREHSKGNILFGRSPQVQSAYLGEVEPMVSDLAHSAGQFAGVAVDQHLAMPLKQALLTGRLTPEFLDQALSAFSHAMSREVMGAVAFSGVHVGLGGLEAMQKRASGQAGKSDQAAVEDSFFTQLGKLQLDLAEDGVPVDDQDIADATEDLNLFLSLGMKPEEAVSRTLRSFTRGLDKGRRAGRQASVRALTQRAHGNAHRLSARLPRASDRSLAQMVGDPTVSVQDLEKYASTLG